VSGVSPRQDRHYLLPAFSYIHSCKPGWMTSTLYGWVSCEHMCSYLSRHLSSCCWPCMHHVQAILICFISIYLLWHCKLISPRLLQLLCEAADVAVGHVRVAWHHSWGWCNQACVSFLWSASRPKLPAKTPSSLCELLVQRHTGP